MVDLGQVDQVPAGRIPLHQVDPLGVGPGETVHRHGGAAQPGLTGRIDDEPPGDQEHPVRVARGGARSVHHDDAVQLGVFLLPSPEGAGSRPGVVVVDARSIRRERRGRIAARVHHEAVGLAPGLSQTEHREGPLQRIPEGDPNLGAHRNPDHRTGILERLTRLAERRDFQSPAGRSFGIPESGACLQPQRQHLPVPGTGRLPVVVGFDHRERSPGRLGSTSGGRHERTRHEEEQGEHVASEGVLGQRQTRASRRLPRDWRK
jgi:hypothetical protein